MDISDIELLARAPLTLYHLACVVLMIAQMKMRDLHATWIIARMQHEHPIGDFTVDGYPHDSMRGFPNTTNPDPAVSSNQVAATIQAAILIPDRFFGQAPGLLGYG